MTDTINHPPHYTAHPSGIECIDVVEHMSFNLGNAIKYIWRADEKGNPLEDLAKAAWYLEREIQRRTLQHGIPCCAGCGGPLTDEAYTLDTPTFVVEESQCRRCREPAMSG